jgi:hypothetical protein
MKAERTQQQPRGLVERVARAVPEGNARFLEPVDRFVEELAQDQRSSSSIAAR